MKPKKKIKYDSYVLIQFNDEGELLSEYVNIGIDQIGVAVLDLMKNGLETLEESIESYEDVK